MDNSCNEGNSLAAVSPEFNLSGWPLRVDLLRCSGLTNRGCEKAL
jgi:hypothetical protein